MNRRKMTDEIKKKLRDPIWQAIGVFLAFIALLTTVVIFYLQSSSTSQSSKRIMISSETSKYLTDFSEPVSKQLHFFIDGKEVRDLRLFVFLIDYKAKEPVRSADFESPIRGSIPNNRKLISVQKAPNIEGPYRVDKETGQVSREQKQPINFEVEILDEHTFQIKPVLMNPGEWLGIEIYTAATNENSPAPPADSTERYKVLSSEVKWSCHVAGVQCPGTVDIEEDLSHMGINDPDFLQVFIFHRGWGVYSIILFTIISLLLQVLLAKAAGLHKATPILQIFLFSIAITSSMASAEVAAQALFPDPIIGSDQPIYAYILFWLNILVIIILAAISIWIRKKKRARARRRTRPNEEESEVAANSRT